MATLPNSPPYTAAKSKLPLGTVPAAKAKTHLLQLLYAVDRDQQSITITKRGKPVAQLVPIQEQTACRSGVV